MVSAGLGFLVSGFWFLVFVFWFLFFGFWFLVFGFWVSGSWCVLFYHKCLWFLVSGVLPQKVSGFVFAVVWFLLCVVLPQRFLVFFV